MSRAVRSGGHIAVRTGLAAALVLIGTGSSPAQSRAAGMASQGLSPFAMAKAERMLRDKLPCLGCHELDGEGGRIGPSFSRVRGTRKRSYIRSMISDPQSTVPGTIMPRVPMSPETLDLIVGYLLQREPGSRPPSPTLPRAATSPELARARAGAVLYAGFCAPCHGVNGDGHGANAVFLPVRPTAHADSIYMSTRSDDALFDAIYAGGYVMNRSHLMPPYGETLDRQQIWELVRHLRTLCGCQGPAWSREGQ